MATREENLKKINDKLELLSDEQLDEIAGGDHRFFAKTDDAGLVLSVQQRLAMAGGNAAALNLAGGNAAALK